MQKLLVEYQGVLLREIQPKQESIVW